MVSPTGFAALQYAQTRTATAPAEAPKQNALGSAAEDFAQTMRNGEAAAKAALTGNADPHSLVQALAETQLAVETTVAVRDRVVEAYQEILRMPV
ncbi:MAG: flagellar hook-basal body complex protein FliE [Pseudomonadota bacterium]